jgi:ribosome-associated protein
MRLQSLVADALAPKKKRRATAPTRSSAEARIAEKKRRSGIKRLRGGSGTSTD